VTLLLVIITPGFFRSPACRAEVTRFLEREQEQGRQDLILPVYYISAREMDDPVVRAGDELAGVLASRQYADWRDLRFEAFTSPPVRKAIAQLAERMRDAFWQPRTAVAAPAGGSGEGPAVSSPGGAEQSETAVRVTVKTEPPTHVVDAFERGDFATVGAAVKAARPGDRILVRPGLYQEGVIVDKPLEILGDGPAADIEIQAHSANVVLFKASIGRIANLTLRQAGGEGVWYGVDITQGRLDLEGCDISSQSSACVGVHDGADPRLRRNQIHDGKQSGVLVYEDGRGTLEDNDITGNTLAGVEIKTGGDPTLRRNQIHDNRQNGVLIQEQGRGTLEDNDITGNTYSGVEIKTGADPTLRRNQIHDNKQGGVYVHDDGRGTLEDNDITGNGEAGVTIGTGADPTVRRNKVNRNGYQAVWIFDGGRGTLEDNDLTGNARGAWKIAEDRRDNVTRARNKE
jgi:parallel beta-helix repeat protein